MSTTVAPAQVAKNELADFQGKLIGPDDYVFPGRDGNRRDRNAVRRRVLYPAIERANAPSAS